jgi:hypothetical protein
MYITLAQERALYDFLENVTEPFTLDDICAFVKMAEDKRSDSKKFSFFSGNRQLPNKIASFINTRYIAFPMGEKQWISRRGALEKVRFVINPTRLEIANGILIPGHRCIPFANPMMLPQEYRFIWKGKSIPWTTSESPPEDFYPFYTLFGEEYAPQYVARDNPENEEAFNVEPFEDPPEVSIQALDMRNIYLEASFVPGDHFAVTTHNWKEGIFELERVEANAWTKADLEPWIAAAEEGFRASFAYLGPGSCTEEQIAFAYWFGGERMRALPAHSMEDFLYEITDHIETVSYGIETRFWYAGKDIPDSKDLLGIRGLPDKTVLEDLLFRWGVPISEFAVQSFVRDALYKGERDIYEIIDKIVPPSTGISARDKDFLAAYILEVFEEFEETYSSFADHAMGPIRQRVTELHTAVLELAIQLQKSSMDPSWLPKHTFVVLSQIQEHAASILEDLNIGEEDKEDGPSAAELQMIDSSIDSMLETYEDIRDLINESLSNFRKNNIGLWQKDGTKEASSWHVVQISLGGTDIWRRLALPDTYTLQELSSLIKSIFTWDSETHKYNVDNKTIGEICSSGISEFFCEIGAKWTVKLIVLSWYQAKPGEQVTCVAGAGAAPPNFIDGPLRFRRFISSLEQGIGGEHRFALNELDKDYDPDKFDIDSCNHAIHQYSAQRGGNYVS